MGDYDDMRLRNLLDAGPGKTLTWDEGEVELGKPAPVANGGASLSGPTPKFSHGEPVRGLGNTAPVAGPAAPPRTPQDLLALANELTARTAAQSVLLDQGPSVKRVSSGSPDNGYNTELTDGAEKAYPKWLASQAAEGRHWRGLRLPRSVRRW